MERTRFMEILGTIEEITCDGRLIICCSELPDIGSPVYSKNEKRLGTVGRVFGPVDNPYASVKPEDTSARIGMEVFFRGNKQNAKGKRRNRRN